MTNDDNIIVIKKRFNTELPSQILTSVLPTVTHVMSMPFVTTQMDLTNAAAILGSLEMDKPALVKIIVIVVVLLVLFLSFLSRV